MDRMKIESALMSGRRSLVAQTQCLTMFIKCNKTSLNGKPYTSTLLVQGKRVPAKRPPGRPTADSLQKSVVIHETLANLSKLPPALIDLIETHCQNSPVTPPPPPFSPSIQVPDSPLNSGQSIHVGPCFGLLAAPHVSTGSRRSGVS